MAFRGTALPVLTQARSSIVPSEGRWSGCLGPFLFSESATAGRTCSRFQLFPGEKGRGSREGVVRPGGVGGGYASTTPFGGSKSAARTEAPEDEDSMQVSWS
jgi:hypothetical protein